MLNSHCRHRLMRVSENYRFESDSVVTRVRVAKKERKKEKKRGMQRSKRRSYSLLRNYRVTIIIQEKTMSIARVQMPFFKDFLSVVGGERVSSSATCELFAGESIGDRQNKLAYIVNR